MLLLPLKISGMKSMRKMQALQPQIQAINEKYKNVGMRDPRKAEQNQEVMDLYKKHGVNPLGAGCMPLLLQIPFFFAFYKVLERQHRNARRELALGYRSVAAGDAGDSHSAAGHDRHAVLPAEDDAADPAPIPRSRR